MSVIQACIDCITAHRTMNMFGELVLEMSRSHYELLLKEAEGMLRHPVDEIDCSAPDGRFHGARISVVPDIAVYNDTGARVHDSGARIRPSTLHAVTGMQAPMYEWRHWQPALYAGKSGWWGQWRPCTAEQYNSTDNNTMTEKRIREQIDG